VHGPIGQPAPFVIAASSASGVTRASSSTRTQSFSSGIRMRLTTKPGRVVARNGDLAEALDDASAVSTGSSDESSARTTSTSGISGAGLKKCIPTTRSGDDVAAAISVTDSADVFVASTAPRGRSLELGEERALRSSSSTIASITRSQSRSAASRSSSSRRATRVPIRPACAGPSRPCA
jgi:hypothetical protein